MNLLARKKVPAHAISLLRLTKRHFYLHPITALQQCNFYSARTPHNSPKPQQFTKPRAQKPSESSTSVSQRIKEQTVRVAVWPKPKEIPYQAKVANFVNLIGYVKKPVQVEAASDGKHFAATVISQGSGETKSSLLIPVVFEGDLANVVACHVKENDCVFVSGKLSLDPLQFVFNESLGKFHLVAENLNFVEGFKRSVSSKNLGVSFSEVEISKPVGEKSDEVTKTVEIEESLSQQWNEALQHAKGKTFSVKNEWASSVPEEKSVKPLLNVDVEEKNLVNDEVQPERANGKKRNWDVTLDLWTDLVKNPLQWWDYRDHKAKGLVKEKFPDFKQKETGEGLWLDTAPSWVLPGFEKLEFDVMATKAQQVDDSWKNLVENPNKWWDNRFGKRNPKSPDFKHKETGEALWLSDIPDWALSRLPPSNDGQYTAR